MRRRFPICLILVGLSYAQTNGILVDKPKVYDDYYLQMQLDSLKARLAAINAADQATLLGKIGGIQGSTLQQSGFSVQGLGPATPAVTTSLPPAGVAPSGTNGTTTATSSLTPAASTPPAPSLSVPSTFSPSSLDTLNEEMQLSFQIINLQLLLEGALSDRFTPRGGRRQHVTVGFSITVNAAAEKKKTLANNLAEVEITLKNPPDLAAATEVPSVMTLLPREKTYNVASLTDKSVSLGAGGVIAGVFNVGAGWLWGKKTYYLVQQQDTLALQRNISQFAWQFRPVLNRKFVVSGTRQTFVQFSVPISDNYLACSAQIHIHTGWRKLDPKNGLTSENLTDTEDVDYPVPFFDLTPKAQVVEVADIGGGLVSISVFGDYMQGTHFRVGSTIIDQSSPNFSFSRARINFIAAAKDIAAFGVVMIARDGTENSIYNGKPFFLAGPCAAPAAPPPAPALPAAVPGPAPAFTATAVVTPFSDTQSLVTISLGNPPADFSKPGTSLNPVAVSIGDQVFGLRNAPFRTAAGASITFLAPNDLLKANRKLKVGQLLWGDGYIATADLPPGAFPSNDFSVSGASIVRTGDPEKVVITGSGLTGTTLLEPNSSCATLTVTQPTLAILTIQKACVDQLKEVLLSNGSNPPLVVTVPAAKPDSQSAKPALKPQTSVALNATQITITGSGLDQVSTIRFGKTRLSFTLSLKKDSIAVALTPDIAATEGVRYLDVTFADGTKSRYELNVKKPS